MADFTHLNKQGEALMVDVGEKDITRRTARAFAKVKMQKETLQKLLNSELKKGDGLATATIADCDYTVKIPMSHGVDSLNVAAASAVAFWQLGNRS